MQIKRMITHLSLLLLAFCLLTGCVPHDSGSDIPDWMWPKTSFEEKTEATVVSTGLTFVSNGNGTCRLTGRGTCLDTELVIPAVSPAGDRVVALGVEAFLGCTDITSVVLPVGVEHIGEAAFSGCESLEDIHVPDRLEKIGAQAFWGCKALREIRIPAATVEIGEIAFYGCRRLKTAIFERTKGWRVTLDEDEQIKLDKESLSDPEQAADLLKDDHVYEHWSR